MAKSQDFSTVTNSRGKTTPNPEIRDYENVPLPQLPTIWLADPSKKLGSTTYRATVGQYMTTEVLPHIQDAWVDHNKTKIGYEIPLTCQIHTTKTSTRHRRRNRRTNPRNDCLNTFIFMPKARHCGLDPQSRGAACDAGEQVQTNHITLSLDGRGIKGEGETSQPTPPFWT